MCNFLFFSPLSYGMMNEEELLKLPIETLLRPQGLVAVWITNNERLESHVKEELFPHWNLQCVAKWYWLKVIISVSFFMPYQQIGLH